MMSLKLRSIGGGGVVVRWREGDDPLRSTVTFLILAKYSSLELLVLFTSKNCLSSCPLLPGTFRSIACSLPLGETLLNCLRKRQAKQKFINWTD